MAVEDFKVYTQDSGWVSLAQTLPQGTSEGQLLHWDGTQWAAASDGTADGQYLVWNDTAKRWEPGTHVTGNLPISSDDGTVVLDSPSANVFTVSTGGTERVAVSTTDATFSVPVRTPTVKGVVDTDAQIDLDASAIISGSVVGFNVGDPSKNITFGSNTSGIAGGDGVYVLSRTNSLAFSSNEIRFNSDWSGGAAEPTWVMTTDSGLVAQNANNYIKCGTVKGLADTDAQIDLGAELLTTNHTPTQPNSIATKQTVDDKIQVMTTAEYNALGADVNPTTLYCLTD
jgi:hypothetical protein